MVGRARWLVIVASLALVNCSLFLGESEDDEPGDNRLAALDVSRGVLEPAFDPEIESYTLALPLGASDLAVTPTAADPNGAVIEIDGTEVASGTASPPTDLALGPNTIDVVVTARDRTRAYSIAVSRGAGILQQVYAKPSNPGRNDAFGRALALDGDVLAVGASGRSVRRSRRAAPAWPPTTTRPAPGRSTSSRTASRDGCKTSTSSPRSGKPATTSATRWRSRATPWWSAPRPRTAAASLTTTAPRTRARSTCSSTTAACGEKTPTSRPTPSPPAPGSVRA